MEMSVTVFETSNFNNTQTNAINKDFCLCFLFLLKRVTILKQLRQFQMPVGPVTEKKQQHCFVLRKRTDLKRAMSRLTPKMLAMSR